MAARKKAAKKAARKKAAKKAAPKKAAPGRSGEYKGKINAKGIPPRDKSK